MGVWNHIICEAYCTFAYASKKVWKTVLWKGKDESPGKEEISIMKNKDFIPPNRRPRWCRLYNKRRVPQFYCLDPAGAMCPFLAITDCTEKEYYAMLKSWEKIRDKELKECASTLRYRKKVEKALGWK